MLKKMQNRFILAAMTAFGSIMLLLVVGINVINYVQISASQDEMLDHIHEYNESIEMQIGMNPPSISDMEWASDDETEFTMRFFSVKCDENGNVVSFEDTYITSVDEKDAQQYASAILEEERERGYYKDYRYRMSQTESGYEIIFLNVAQMQQFRDLLLVTSLGISVISFLLVFILVVLLSKRAIRPYAENIKRQKRFITDAGHELKTPITSIITSADILACENEENEWIQNIQRQSQRLTKLVGDLVALSRLDEDNPWLENELFSVSDAAWEISESLSDFAEAKGKCYEPQIENDLKMVGDRTKIQQLISILLENAIQYSDENGSIQMKIYQKNGRIRIDVRNTCLLIDDSDVEHWFDRFYRPDASRSTNTGGTGIGLSMAQAIVEAHRGQISVKTEDGKAITFKVIL